MNISRDTFNIFKHYNGVRLQQGVPLVDADWNEMEDIRKFELQNLLKWFIGNGVPSSWPCGFQIMSTVNKIILTSKKKDFGLSVIKIEKINDEDSAAVQLGFDKNNSIAYRFSPPSAQLITEINVINFETTKNLYLRVDGSEELKVEFPTGTYSSQEIISIINNSSVGQLLIACAGDGNDLIIKGGFDPHERIGLFLVEGFLVINECDLTYTNQSSITPIPPPPVQGSIGRIDLVYLDVWEKFIDYKEDPELINPDIGVETCFRNKIEWAVRIEKGIEGSGSPPRLLHRWDTGHVFFELAEIARNGRKIIDQVDIKDLRPEITRLDWVKSIIMNEINLFEGKFLVHDHSGGEKGKLIDKNGLAINSVTENILQSDSQQDSNRAVTTNHIKDQAVTEAKLDILVKNKMIDLNRIHKVPLLQQTIYGRSCRFEVGLNLQFAIVFDGTYMWISHPIDSISKIDITSNKIVNTISGIKRPTSMAFDGNYIWVTNQDEKKVTKINIITDAIQKTVDVGEEPNDIVFDGKYIWVINSKDKKNVSKINTSTDTVENTVTVPLSFPSALVFDGKYIWVTGGGSVSKIDSANDNVEGPFQIGSQLHGAAFDGTHIWVVDSLQDCVNKIEIITNLVVETVPVENSPYSIVFDGTHIWVATQRNRNVSKIDINANSVVANIPVGIWPYKLAFDGTHIWVIHWNDKNVFKIKK